MASRKTQRLSFAFTLTEVLVVMAIMAILAAVAFPSLSKYAESGRKATCLSNLKQLGQATLNYAADHQQKYPLFRTYYSGGGMNFWYMEIRPYLGATNTELPRSSSYPHGRNLDVFYCPSVDRKLGYPHTDYGANTYVFSPPTQPDEVLQSSSLRIPNPSKTAMYSEILGEGGSESSESSWQLVARRVRGNPDRYFPRRHGDTVHMVFCDGHAEGVPRHEVVANFTNYFGDREFWRQ